MLVDSHCHLDFPEFAHELDEVVERARQAGVGAVLTIGTHLSRFAGVRAVAERFDRVWCSVGVHPHEADAEGVGEPATLVRLAEHAKVVGLGETGLDYHYEHSSREAQQASFRAHLDAAAGTGLPLIVHSRAADDDTAAMLRAGSPGGRLTGVLHCFTASRALAEAALELGFYVSFSGIVTFKNAGELRETARAVPLDRLLVETDAPYLAPVPLRGRRNEPSFLPHTAALLAELKGVSVESLAKATTDNFFRLFAKARRPDAGTHG